MALIEGVSADGSILPIKVSTSGELVVGSQSGSEFTVAEIGSVQTSTTGSEFVVLQSGTCRAVDLVNATEFAIEYRRNGSGEALAIPAGSARLIIGITNSNQISIRRVDRSNTQITVNFERLS